jgi:hypothetical protein
LKICCCTTNWLHQRIEKAAQVALGWKKYDVNWIDFSWPLLQRIPLRNYINPMWIWRTSIKFNLWPRSWSLHRFSSKFEERRSIKQSPVFCREAQVGNKMLLYGANINWKMPACMMTNALHMLARYSMTFAGKKLLLRLNTLNEEWPKHSRIMFIPYVKKWCLNAKKINLYILTVIRSILVTWRV